MSERESSETRRPAYEPGLVTFRDRDGEPRVRLLETVRELLEKREAGR